MARTITVVLPDGYEDTTHLVLVATETLRQGGTTRVDNYVNVLRVLEDNTTEYVEEVGQAGLAIGLNYAGRIIRNDRKA